MSKSYEKKSDIQPAGRIEYIDTLRFIAILIIVFNHYDQQVFYNVFSTDFVKAFADPPAILNWILYGWTGKYALAILCCISGFILAQHQNDSPESLDNFIVKRYLRLIIPCSIVSIILFVINIFQSHSFALRELFISSLWPGFDNLNPHFWCIDEFLIGSIIILLIMIALKGKPSTAKLITFFITAITFVLIGQLWIGACVLGAFCYYLSERINCKQHIPNITKILWIALIWWLKRDVYESISDITYIRNIIGAFLLILLIATTPSFCRILSCKSWNLRKYSYSLFVCHFITFTPAEMLLRYLSSAYEINMWADYIIVFLIKTLADLLIAYTIYHLGERCLYFKCLSLIRQRTSLLH